MHAPRGQAWGPPHHPRAGGGDCSHPQYREGLQVLYKLNEHNFFPSIVVIDLAEELCHTSQENSPFLKLPIAKHKQWCQQTCQTILRK